MRIKNFLLFLFLIHFSAKAQYLLTTTFLDSTEKDLSEKFAFINKAFSNENEINEALNKLLFDLRQIGYLTASIDTVVKDSNSMNIFVYAGNVYKWGVLDKGNVEDEVLSNIGFSYNFFSKKSVSASSIALLMDRILTYEENNGFPFASIKLDSINILASQINAVLKLEKNNFCVIDSFIVKGNSKLSYHFFSRQLGIKKGQVYNESSIQKISGRLNNIVFLKEAKPAQIYFTDKYTKLILFVNERKANRLDGVLGFLPNDVTGKLQITGQLNLRLCNSFSKGEILDVDWQKLQPRTQQLKARLQIPFLLKSPFGADLNFKLYKRDTLFLDVNENLGLTYQLGIANYMKFFYFNRTSNLISTKGYENLVTLPDFADISSQTYGIGFRTERLDYKFNPRKGFFIEINASAGNRKIKRNLKINPLVYNGLDLKTTLYMADFSAELFVPIKTRSTFLIGNKSALVESANLFSNETYRIGGLSTLRGFDEESINASAYSISKIEYRFLMDRNSFLFAFYNQGFYINKTKLSSSLAQRYVNDKPYGFGAGISFETKPGIFTLTYAIGKQFNNPILLRSAKIHFGIVSAF